MSTTTPPLPPLRWFIFKDPRGCRGSLSRTEAEAVAEVRRNIQGRGRKTWPPTKTPEPTDAPPLIRDTEVEDKANAILFGHALPRA